MCTHIARETHVGGEVAYRSEAVSGPSGRGGSDETSLPSLRDFPLVRDLFLQREVPYCLIVRDLFLQREVPY